jgi:hypothetical protein
MSCKTLVAIVLLVSAPAIAQDLNAELRAACKADYDKFCKDTSPGGGRIIACLSKQNDKLADACRKAVAAVNERRLNGAKGQ